MLPDYDFTINMAWVVTTFMVVFAVCMSLMWKLICLLKNYKFGQVISSDGPQSHASKEGTPTMGGISIYCGVLLGLLAVLFRKNSPELWAIFVLLTGFFLIGLADDKLTIRPVGGVRGIASKPKFVLQFLLSALFVVLIGYIHGFTDVLVVGKTVVLSGVLYYIFAAVFVTGMANFINIADGLDGLAAGLTTILVVPYTAVAMFFAAPYAPCMAALGASTLAFLWYNTNPAKVFMGDTGSLTIGAFLPAYAIVTHTEVLLIVLGAVFILDGLSSGLQWAVFKYTRITTGTGRRVFKKSPVHHHFELCGYPEQTIVVRFWIAGVLAAVVGYFYYIWSAA